jgi:hypothetical protein
MGLGALDGLDGRGRVGLEARDVAQQRGGPREPCGGRLRVLVQEPDGLLQARDDPLGVLEPAALGAQVVLLAVAELDRVDLGELEAVEVFLAGALAHLVPQPRERPARFLPPPHQDADPLAQVLGLREAVQEQELARRLQQALVLVLAVQLHEGQAQPLEQPHGGGPVVDEGAVPAGPRQLPLDHQLAVAGRVPGLVEQRGHRPRRIDLEDGLDHRGVGPGADPVRLGTRAGHEEERVHHDGLARPGLAGEDVEAGGEGHHRLLDHGQVADGQLAQHRPGHATANGERRSTVSYRSPHLSFVRRTEKKCFWGKRSRRMRAAARPTSTVSSTFRAKPTWPSRVSMTS